MKTSRATAELRPIVKTYCMGTVRCGSQERQEQTHSVVLDEARVALEHDPVSVISMGLQASESAAESVHFGCRHCVPRHERQRASLTTEMGGHT